MRFKFATMLKTFHSSIPSLMCILCARLLFTIMYVYIVCLLGKTRGGSASGEDDSHLEKGGSMRSAK